MNATGCHTSFILTKRTKSPKKRKKKQGPNKEINDPPLYELRADVDHF
jgi:hypothetical protein